MQEQKAKPWNLVTFSLDTSLKLGKETYCRHFSASLALIGTDARHLVLKHLHK